MPSVEFEDKDLLEAIQNETNLDMSKMIIIKKEIIDNKLRIFYRPNRKPIIYAVKIKSKRGK